MEAVFLVCFLVGLCMTILSLVLGVGHIGGIHLGHFGGHGMGHGGEIGHGGAGHGAASPSDTPGLTAGFLNFTTIMTFITWFGGVGYLFSHYTPVGGVISLIIASVSGVGGGMVVALFITRVLEAGQTEMRAADYRIEGTVARVTSTIFPGYAGEVIYTMAGTTQASAARSVTGEEIPRGTEVVILRHEQGTVFVDTWAHALGEGDDAKVEVTRSE